MKTKVAQAAREYKIQRAYMSPNYLPGAEITYNIYIFAIY